MGPIRWHRQGFDKGEGGEHLGGVEVVFMRALHLLVAPLIVADIPPPPPPFSLRQHSAEEWFWAICAAAGVGLWVMFRRRSKKPIPGPEDGNQR